MAEFINGITDMLSGIFTALINALASTGNLIFDIGENGAISGVTGFGWLLIAGISIPLATWLFTKIFSWVKGFARGGSR